MSPSRIQEPGSVAVIGISGRFPGAPDIASFWRNLRDGVEAARELSQSELEAAGVEPDLLLDPRYVRTGVVLEDVDRFDASFFGLTPREAELMDPQHRLFLECAWEAMEDAGYDSQRAPGEVGVFTSSLMSHYLLLHLLPRRELMRRAGVLAIRIFNDKDFLPTRVSYELNLRGPSLAVQTACSSSLVGCHLACQSLINFECDMALVGGVALNLPQAGYLYQEGSIYSPDGHCRAFDAQAQGTINGSGAGIVVLRRLEDAVAAGDRIRAVIRGTAVNNDGSLKVGFTAPSVEGQAAVVAAALEFAGVDPDTLGLIEAHGTGTPMGDPVEVAALTQVFRETTSRRGFCALGSVKASIGHLDAAAGVAGLIKAVLALEHKVIPPSVNCDQPSPEIDLPSTPFYVVAEAKPWVANGVPRRAGVTSLGVGGTNVHVVLEEAPPRQASGESRPWQVLVWSARDNQGLEDATRRLADHLESGSTEPLADLAFTLQMGRAAFGRRRALVCRSREEALESLRGVRGGGTRRWLDGGDASGEPEVAFLFPGQGSQHPGMGRELYRSEPVYREAIDDCAERLRSHLGLDLRLLLHASDEEAAGRQLQQTRIAQPALFAVEYALARLWMDWGVTPRALLGHSVGEYVAACLAGVLSLADALELVAVRGRLMQSLPPGAMLSVALAPEEIEPLLDARLSLAAINAEAVTTVAGPAEAVEALAARLSERKVEHRRLRTSHAFHSAMVEPVVGAFVEQVARMKLRPPQIRLLSNVSGTWMTPQEATDPRYWGQQLRRTVRFSAALRELLREPEGALLEVGPGQSLTRLARLHRQEGQVPWAVASMRHPQQEGEDFEQLLGALGRLWAGGVRIDWERFSRFERRRRVAAPTYPFQRQRYWIEPASAWGVHEEPARPEGSLPESLAEIAEGGLAAAPFSPLELAVARVWREVLGVERIVAGDDFFELGGNSLTATQVVSRLWDTLRIQASVQDLFNSPTVAGLAARLSVPAARPEAPAGEEPAPELPLSYSQHRFWMLDQLMPGNAAYNMLVPLRLWGELSVAALAASCREIARRHESLRTRFELSGKAPVRIVLPDLPLDVAVIDLEALPVGAREAEVARRIRAERNRAFDLERGPLMRASLLRLAAREHVLLPSFHHIIFDGWSLYVLVAELAALIPAAMAGAVSPLPEPAARFSDFVLWQRQRMQEELLERELGFWRDQLAGIPRALDLPADFPRPSVQGSRGASRFFTLPTALTGALRTLGRSRGATLFMTLLTAFQALLSRITGEERLLIGTPVAGRSRADVEGLIGCFVNTLVIPGDVSGGPGFSALLERVRDVVLAALGHQELPFERLVDELQPERDLSRTPLFQVMLILQNARLPRIELPGLAIEAVSLDTGTAKFDLTLAFVEDGAGELEGLAEYRTDLFLAPTILRLLAHFESLLQAAVADPGCPVADLPLLSEVERHQLSVEWNDSAGDVGAPELVHGMFELQAERSPWDRALTFGKTSLTYGELNARANRLAHWLVREGVGPEVRVGIECERSPEMVVAMLAVHKAGGAYVPMDPSYPRERLALVREDAGAALVLTRRRLEELAGSLEREPEDNPPAAARPDNAAYVIYTSGSTGRPKGVVVTHRNAASFFAAMDRRLGAGDHRSRGVWLAVTSISFDISVLEILWTLARGFEVVLQPETSSAGIWPLVERLPGVTHLQCTPSMARLIVSEPAGAEALGSLLQLLVGGEALAPALARQLRGAVRGELHNMYGPTETTVWSSTHRMEAVGETVPIGRPLLNTGLFILDRGFAPVPAGVPGELLIGGRGVVRGYLGRPDLTAERFVPDPFAAESGSRLYATGDRARWRADGSVEFLGRVDHQVKIRGHRIEPGEIERALDHLPEVGESVVVLGRDGIGEPVLVAYVAGADGSLLSPQGLRESLRRWLPEPMVPSRYVMLEALPRTPNGKVDRRALPEPEWERETGRDYVPPRNAFEKTLATVWSEVLGIERVGVRDNFFELGGDSIQSLWVRSLAQQRGVGLSVQQLFQHPTVERLAAALASAEPRPEQVRRAAPFELVPEADLVLLPEGLEDAYPLTALQMGMLFFSEIDDRSATYHDVFSYHLRAPLEPGELATALERLVVRHPVLRTSFDLRGFSEPLQLVHPAPLPVPLEVRDLSSLDEASQEAAVAEWLAAERLRPFDWTRPPLLRLQVHRRSAGTFELTLSFHHAILDGWSVATLMTELFQDYLGQGRAVAPQALMRDYVAREREVLESEDARRFWSGRLEEAPVTALPVWPGFGPSPERRTERLGFEVPAQVAGGLHELARRLGIPIKSVLLAAHLRVLVLVGGQGEVTTGLVLNARPEEVDGERVLGLFLNSLPFRLDAGGSWAGSWSDLALRAFEEERALLAHRLYPLARMQREAGGRPLFETLFNFIHFHVYQALAGVLSLELLGSTVFEETNYPLVANFAFDPSGTGLLVDLVYDAARVAPAQAEGLAGYYGRALAAIGGEPMGESLLSAAEAHQLVLEWNDSATSYAPWPETLHGWIEAQAARTPEAPAVLFDGERLSYSELNRRADRLADRLQDLGVGPDVLAGVNLERSLELMVALLGVLKAGGAYVPFDRGYPAERLGFMVEDSGVQVLLTSELLARLESSEGPAVRRPRVWGESLAYMIYTSGSTGRPKGAMNSHRGIVNRLLWMQEAYGLTSDDRVLQKTPLSFDVSVWELFWPLMTGACLVLARPEGHRDSAYLSQVIAQEGVTTLHFVPSMLRAFLEEEGIGESCTGLRRVMASGEALPVDLVERFHATFAAGTELHNLYGPTEAAVDVTSWRCDRESRRGLIPIGKPIANLRTHMVNRELRPVALGVPGELLLGGVGLARGYWRRADQTAERFIPDPLGKEPGGRLYRTGDLARYLPDGAIEFLGRLDHQVKVRGFRIELGEIEVALSAHPSVNQAVVLARENRSGEKRLVAYMVARGGALPASSELSAFLGMSLPEHMVPSSFVWLPALPLTPSGKLDRRALPAPERDPEGEYVAPRNAVEETLTAVWSEALGVERIGIHDSFFALGGDSINSLRVRALAQRQGIAFALPQLFQHPTVERLAAALAVEEARPEPERRTAPFELVPEADRALLPKGLEDAYPVTALQMGMLFYSELDSTSATYHDVFSYHLRAPLEPAGLEAALERLVARHPVLRTSFDLRGFGEPMQLVHKAPLPLPLEVSDLTSLDEAAQESAFAEWLAAERLRPFDWTRPPLLRLQVHRRSAGTFELTLSFHHAILDGWSVATLMTELFQDYLGEGRPTAPQALMRDYVAREREVLESEEARRFWSGRLEEAPVTALPVWPGFGPSPERRTERLGFEVPAQVAGGLHELARRLGIPIKSVLLAAHLRVLVLVGGQGEVTTGLVLNARPEEVDGERVLGLFLNSLPFRLDAGGSWAGSWSDLALRAFEEERALLAHRLYPLARMQREAGGRPLFETLFNFIHFHVYQALAGVPSLELLGSTIFEETNYPLVANFAFDPSGTGLLVELVYDAARVAPAQAQGLAGYYGRALSAIAGAPLGESLLSAAETHQLVLEWNDSAVGYEPQPETLHGWIEAQAARTPEAPAVIFDGERLSYGELNRRAERLADRLQDLGVGPDVLAGVSLERSLELMVALLGVLKAGGAYVPFDRGYPAERLGFMVEDSGVQVLLTSELFASLESSEGPAVRRPRVCGESLAYMIYTSGSTGRPKGAMNSHRGIVNRLLWMQEAYGLTSDDRVLQKTPLSFDVSVWELFWPLMTGACLVMARPEGHRDSAYLSQVIAQEGVTTLHFVPSMLRAFLEEEGIGESCSGLRRVMASGEALPMDLVERFHETFAAGTELHNLYGPTEAAVDVTSWRCDRESRRGLIPIGKPIANLRTHVVDRELRPVALGVPGELLLGGVGLARGYWRRPDQTAERFIPDPLGREPGSRLYRTGDLARYLPDGAIEFLGRLDHQVKVRGFRIELGEIEAALSAHPSVGQAVVLAREDRPGEKRLVAYMVGRGEALPASSELSAFLGTSLPEHMVPSAFVWLPALPLTPSGKLDRRALPAPDRDPEGEHVAPRNALEEALAAVWSEVLGVDRVGIHDSFFALGGDSINSLRVRALAQRRGIAFVLPQLFQHPTVERLAVALAAAEPLPEPVRRATPFELVAEADLALLPEGLEDAYPLTALQMGMLFFSEIDDRSATYHNVFSYHLRAPLEPGALSAALERLLARHPVLRTGFDLKGFSVPLQLVHPPSASLRVPVELRDLAHLGEAEQEAAVAEWLAAERREPFDWTRPPLLRLRVHRRSAGSCQITLSFHHAILDGWSVSTLLSELLRDYLQRMGVLAWSPEPAPPKALMRDYVALEREVLVSRQAREFWAARLEDAPMTALPSWTGAEADAMTARRAERLRFEVPAELAGGLHDLARRLEIPIKSVLLAAHLRVLSLLSGSREVMTGVVVNGRPEEADGERVLGLFLNSVPLRSEVGEGSWAELARRAFEEERAMLPYRRYPMAQMQRDAGGQPLFGILFNFLHFRVYEVFAGVRAMDVVGDRIFEETNFPLEVTFSLGAADTGIQLEVIHDAAQILAVQAQAVAGYCLRALSAMSRSPESRLGEADLLSDPETQQLLVEWNDTAVFYPAWPETLHGWIEAQAARTPEAPAVIFEEELLSYRELNRRADRLAEVLREMGVGPEVLVGVYLERSLELSVALLAVLKSGGAYVPLDPSYPVERLRLMIEDSRAPVLLTVERLAAGLPAPGARLMLLDGAPAAVAPSRRPPLVLAENLAYTTFTSGSTGRPKGAMNSHRGIVNRLLWMQQTYPLTRSDRVVQKTPLSFDDSAVELFWPLISGACLVMARPEGHRDSAYLRDLAGRHDVAALIFVPSMLRAFLDEDGLRESCGRLRHVVASGEALPPELVERFHATFPPGTAELHNLYGPTEAAVDVSSWTCERGSPRKTVPIGRPIANLRLHVLDRNLRPAPAGVPGELMVGGVGLARGYWERPDQTANRFIPDPVGAEPGQRLYRTGDLTRHLPDGAIEFLGRLDHQVKVRGFRIELEEIEGALARHPRIRQAVVLAREDRSGDKRLVAYLVTRDGDPGAAELRSFLGASLPDYMVPAAFVVLPELPLTPNGKLDRKALPAPDLGRLDPGSDYAVPRTPREAALAAIWAEVLGVERVGIHDSFFALGGDSILSIQVVSRAHRAGMRLTPRQLFLHPTVAELAPLADAAPAAAAEQGAVVGAVPLMPIQEWFFELDLAEPHHWNLALLLEVRKPTPPALLERAVEALLLHHDALRLRFDRDGSGWSQRAVAPGGSVPFIRIDLAALPDSERRAEMERGAARLHASLDLARGPLLRAASFRLASGLPDRLLLVIHHLAVDGVSWRILVEDLATACEQLARGEVVSLPPKTTSFQDWARRLAERARSGEQDAEAAYWAGMAAAVPPLPLDGHGDDTVASARTVEVALDAGDTQALLQEVPQAYRTRIEDLLLTALAQALAGWVGGRLLRVDLEAHGREELFAGVDLTRTVGWFTALFPVLLDLRGAEEPGAALKAVKEQLRAIPNRGVGYGLLRYLRGDGPATAALRALPAAGLSFNYFGRLDQVLPAGSRFVPARESSGPARSPLGRRSHPLGVDAAVTEGCLRVVWTYSPALHRQETVERVARGHLDALRALIAHCRTPGVAGYTPSDFPLAEIDQGWLDRLARRGGKVEDIYPLSPMQEGMLFHSLSDPQPGMYFQQIGLALHGPLDAGTFARAWWLLLERHSALRTAFAWEGLGRPHQIVFAGLHLPWLNLDWRSLSRPEQERELDAMLKEDRRRGFDLAVPPLLRLTLARRAEAEHELVISVHHLLVDGWSLSLLVREAFELYRALTEEVSPAAAHPRPYRDYIAWLLRQDLEKAAAFWRRSLTGFTAPTPLGIDRPSEAREPEDGEVQEHFLFSLPPVATDALQKQARQLRVTLNTMVQGAWALLLGRYSGERDVVFGVTGSGRPAELAEIESMVGLFINTLPGRVEVDGAETLARWLGRLQELQVEARQYDYTPLTQVQASSEVPRRLPLFESLFLFENFPIDSSLGRSSGGVEIRGLRTFQRTNYPLVFAAVPGESLSLRLSFERRRFDRTAIGRLAGHLTVLLGALAEPHERLAGLPLLSPAEHHQLLFEWQGVGIEGTGPLCVHRLFEARVESAPQAPALAYEERVFTYRELNRQANRLAHRLRDLGTGPEVLVGICSRRSPEMIIGLLAVLKAGGAYLPLDPGSPADRLRLQLEDAGAPILLAQPDLAEGPAEGWPLRLELTASAVVGEEWDENLAGAAAPDNAAYALYTSGSTGLPKAVVVEHGQLCTYVRGVLSRLDLSGAASFATVSTLAADLGNTAIFPALASGGCLHLISEERASHPEAFADYFEREAVDCLKIVPSHFKALWRSLGSRRSRAALPRQRLIFGGEASLRQDVAELRELAPDCAVFNHYGPTESTVGVLTLRVDNDMERRPGPATVPLGRPIPGVRVYILDREQRPLPAGIAGELCIAGATLARGYLRRPELTAERFMPDPWSGEPGGRMYRTGDLAVHLADGNLLFLGRIDHQVKVRGFRVEPAEIEEVLRRHPGVREALVLADEGEPGELRLTAFLVAARTGVAAEELRALARRQLPEHMVPSGFVLLESLPLTPNGKVDRRTLQARIEDGEPAGSLFEPPAGELEQTLSDIWSEVLGGRRIGRHDNYFELGGHSLTAIPIMSRLRERTGVELPLGTLFERPTIAELAGRVEEIRAGRAAAASVVDLAADAALDPAITRSPGIAAAPAEAPAAVLLTGATGLLGTFLLDELLRQTGAKVYCLVRATGPEEAGKRLRRTLASQSLSLEDRQMSRIVPLAGDLSRPLLGLASDVYRDLAGKLDSIYHNGALVNFAYPYPALRAANVLGTHEVLRLASEGRTKAVHQVSTIDVFFSRAFAGRTLIREDDEPADSTGLAGGYVQSKWVAERLVAAARDRSMPVSIFRPARVSWHSRTGAWSATDLLSQVLSACLRLGSAPELDWQIDIVPVDYVSRAIVHLSLRESSLGRAFHLVHPRPVSWAELVGRLHDCGCPLQTLPLGEWRARLAETPDPALAPLRALTAGWRAELPEMERAQETSLFDSRRTREALAGTSISCPPIDGRLLEAYLKRLAHPGLSSVTPPAAQPRTGAPDSAL